MSSSFRIDTSFQKFVSELKEANKKFKTFKNDIRSAFEEVSANPRAGDQIPNTRDGVFKIRIGVKGQIGKRGGYRMIYHVDFERQVITPIALYFKPDTPQIPDHEVTRRYDELINQLKLATPPAPNTPIN